MSETIGRVDFIVGLDGTTVPAQARKVGEKIGQALGQEARSSFAKELGQLDKEAQGELDAAGARLSKRLEAIIERDMGAAVSRQGRNLGRQLGNDFSDGFSLGVSDRMANSLQRALDPGDAVEDIGELHVVMQQVGNDFVWIRGAIEGAGSELRTHSDATDDSVSSTGRLSASLRALNDRLTEAAGGWDLFDSSRRRAQGGDDGSWWNGMSHNTKQWTLIIAALAAGMQDIAVLGSAAGAGLVAVGSAATSAVLGGGALIGTLIRLGGEISELPPELRATAEEMQQFGRVSGNVLDSLVASAANRMSGSFDSLGESVVALRPALMELGNEAGGVFERFARAVKPGTRELADLDELVRNAGPNFSKLADGAGTFASGLIVSFNRSQPMVDRMLDGIESLADRFQAFSRSREFDQWMSGAQTTLSAVGRLLSSTGQLFDDLVKPDAIARTEALLDNVSEFMPNLANLLDIIGTADPFGLLAQGLNDFGTALEPLAGPMLELAEQVNRIGSDLIDSLATGLTVVSTALAPVVQGIADFVEAVPDDVMQGLANGLLVAAGAFVVFKGAQGVAGAVDGLRLFVGAADNAVGAGGRLAGVLGKAGLAGAIVGVAVSMPAIIDQLVEYADAASGIDASVKASVRSNDSFAESLNKVNPNLKFTAASVRTLLDAFADAGGNVDAISEPIEGFGDTAMQAQYAASQLARGLGSLDEQLAGMSFDDAVTKFQAWAESTGASRSQLASMIEQMPQFKAALESAIPPSEGLTSTTDLVAYAMSNAAAGAGEAAAGITGMQTSGEAASGALTGLYDKLMLLAEQQLISRDAARQFEAATDDLSASIATNGATLDISEASGRANQAAVDALAGATIKLSEETKTQTGSQAAANDVISDGRQRLIEMLGQFGITGQAAEDYVNELGLIPKDVNTLVALNGVTAAEQALANLTRQRIANIIVRATMPDLNGDASGNGRPGFASGGVVTNPLNIRVGESTEEAIVPLNRPLHQVDPSVRRLSAVAQGYSVESSPAKGKQVTFAAGSIVVEEAEDGIHTAVEVVSRIVESVNG